MSQRRGRRPGVVNGAPPSRLSGPWPVIVVGALYVIGAELSWRTFGAQEIGLAFFPPAGITLAAMVILPTRTRRWIPLAVVLAEVAVDLPHGVPLAHSVGYGVANAVEPVVGAFLLAWFLGHGVPDLARSRSMTAFVVTGAIIGPAVGALIGATVATDLSGGSWFTTYASWVAGDGLAVIAFGGPILVQHVLPRRARVQLARETLAVVATTFACTLLVFWFTDVIPPYVLLPVMVWSAFQFGVAGVARAGATLAIVANAATASGGGFYASMTHVSPQAQLGMTQGVIAVSILTAWYFAIEINERASAVAQRDSEHDGRVRAEHLQAVGALSAALLDASTPSDVTRLASDSLFRQLRPSYFAIDLVDESGQAPTRLAVRRAVDGAGLLPLHATRSGVLASTVIEGGRSIWAERGAEITERFPSLPADDEARAAEAVAALPLASRNRVWGALLVLWDEPRSMSPTDRLYLSGVAHVVGLALERTRLIEREHRVTVDLQLAMLGTPDAVEGVDFGADYQPAASGMEIGGDWFDVIDLGEGRSVFVVGDVVGHDIAAAKAMGQLRSAVRALIPTGAEPGSLLSLLEQYAGSLPEAMATSLVYVVHDQHAEEIRYVVAGHPPPLLLRRDGTTKFLTGARGGTLGYVSGPRQVGRERLGPGDSLVLYTDGLVERRGESIDLGLMRLRAAVEQHAELGPAAMCDRLVGELNDGFDQEDDIAVLVARPLDVFRRVVPALPDSIAPLRREVGQWLRALELDESSIAESLVGLGEAVANSVEHAYRDQEPGSVLIEMSLAAHGCLRASVSDQGRWSRPPARPGRGLGSCLMGALYDEVVVDRLPSGTRVQLSRAVERQPRA